MSEQTTSGALFEPTSPHDRRLALRAEGLLRTANEAGLVTAAAVHTATRVCRVTSETDDWVRLALALAAQAVTAGSTCLDLAAARDDRVALDWPDPDQWLAQVAASPLTASGVLRVEHGLVYLDRYHEQETQVADDLAGRMGPVPTVDDAVLEAALERLFGTNAPEQRAASTAAVRQRTTVLTGGPGTGKTTTVARLLALLVEQAEVAGGQRPRIGLTAPTARAAAQLRDAIDRARADLPSADRARLHGLEAMTLHRLLGWKPGTNPRTTSRFRHDRTNRLPHDVVVVDEASMVSLTMMARLLEAVRPEAQLVVVGDPDQLASVDAGAVLADLVAGLRARDDGADVVSRLTHTYRFGSGIGALAQAIRDGDADTALSVIDESDDVELVTDPMTLRGRLVRTSVRLRRHAVDGDAEGALRVLGEHRLLCAHRTGPTGVTSWNRHVEQWVAEETGETYWTPMYPGRPLLVTANDYANGLLNGDTGVVLRRPDGLLGAELDTTDGRRQLPTSRLSEVDTMHAMTVHKAQGSQARHVTMVLPEDDSPLLTRELLYTGVTRAQDYVTIVATPDTVRAAIDRRSQRASGLALRLAED